MATFAALKSEVAADLSRAVDYVNNAVFTSQVENAVLDAIEMHSVERFWFNETRGATFSTVDGTANYTVTSAISGTSTDSTTIADFITLEYIQFAQSATSKYRLDWVDGTEMEDLQESATEGQPICYSYYDKQFWLYPIPDGVYTVRVAGHFLMEALSSDDDTNAWTTTARNLIRATARKFLYGRVVKDYPKAQVAELDEMRELERHRAETCRRKASGIIRPNFR
jgi:hypothetical protein